MLTGKIPYDGEDFHEVLENNKKAVIDFTINELTKVPRVTFSLLQSMLELSPEDRPTAKECLEHEYFSSNTFASLVIEDDVDEGINLHHNIQIFKEKYGDVKNIDKGAFDSIKFNANPTIRGNTDTYGSIGGNSHNSKNNGQIDSFNSINRQANAKGSGSQKGSK
jgi:serine/threonine protein kinase